MSNKELTKDVFNGLMARYRYAAVDADGRAFSFVYEPVLGESEEVFFVSGESSPDGDAFLIGGGYDSTDWKNSLVERPHDIENQAKEIAKKDETIKSLNEKIESLNSELKSRELSLKLNLGDGTATILTLLNLSRDLTEQVVDTIAVKNLEINKLSHQIKEDGLLIDSLSHEIEALKKEESYEFSQ